MKVTKGKVVTLTYSIRSESNEMLEQNDIPVSYVHGGNSQLLLKVEHALEGHEAGQQVSVKVHPEEGFGPRDPSLAFTDDLDNVPPEFRSVGARVEMQNDQGEMRAFYVTKIDQGKLTVDGNHPFAGKILLFAVRVLEVREATSDELANGVEQTPPSLH